MFTYLSYMNPLLYYNIHESRTDVLSCSLLYLQLAGQDLILLSVSPQGQIIKTERDDRRKSKGGKMEGEKEDRKRVGVQVIGQPVLDMLENPFNLSNSIITLSSLDV